MASTIRQRTKASMTRSEGWRIWRRGPWKLAQSPPNCKRSNKWRELGLIPAWPRRPKDIRWALSQRQNTEQPAHRRDHSFSIGKSLSFLSKGGQRNGSVESPRSSKELNPLSKSKHTTDWRRWFSEALQHLLSKSLRSQSVAKSATHWRCKSNVPEI